jgi:hypothetical protein
MTMTVMLALSAYAMAAQPAAASLQCRSTGAMARLSGLQEASGLALSRRVPGRLWTHNDSGEPVLFALDANGAITSRLRLAGAAVVDWEAIAVGPCPGGSCIFVADIGDNDAKRKRITVYRLPEPAAGVSGQVQVTGVFHATYPDGPHDAETLLVTPDGTLIVVTKGDTGPVALYRFPREMLSGATVKLERAGPPREPGLAGRNDKITDGDISPDGEWIVLRSTSELFFYRTGDLLNGVWRDPRRVALATLGEPQGEGVAVGAANTIYLAGEGGGKSQPGTFARLACAPAT